MKLSRPQPYGKRSLPVFPGYCAALGPGIIWMACAQGSGELIWWPYLVAKYGLGFMFLLIPACLLQYPLTFEIGRYSALTGESIWKGFIRLSPLFGLLLWFFMLLTFIWFGAWASAGGTALAELTQFPPFLEVRGRSLFWAILAILLFSFALLTRKRTYNFIEKIIWFVAIVTIVGLVVSICNEQVTSVIPEFLKATVIPSGKLPRAWDSADLDKLITAITFAGMGGFWSLFYSHWILGKGIACAEDPEKAGAVPEGTEEELKERGAKWRRYLVFDSGVGIIGNMVTALMMCLLSYALLFPEGTVPEGWRLAVEQSRFFEVSWGDAGRAFFLFIAAAFLVDTWPTVADVVTKISREMIQHFFFGSKPIDEVKWYRGIVCLLTAISLATVFVERPGTLLVLTGIFNFLAMAIYLVALLILIHGPFKKALPQPIKPGGISFALLALSVLTYGGLAIAYLVTRFL